MILNNEDIIELMNMLQINAPEDTGNLKHNGMPSAQVIPKGWQVVIGGSVAPYAPFIKIKGTHNKVLNPWIEDTINEWTQIIADRKGGVVNARINR